MNRQPKYKPSRLQIHWKELRLRKECSPLVGLLWEVDQIFVVKDVVIILLGIITIQIILIIKVIVIEDTLSAGVITPFLLLTRRPTKQVVRIVATRIKAQLSSDKVTMKSSFSYILYFWLLYLVILTTAINEHEVYDIAFFDKLVH
jgi:hypothetical protein